MDKLLLEKDYDTLRKRYDDLLDRVGQVRAKPLPPTGVALRSKDTCSGFAPQRDVRDIVSSRRLVVNENRPEQASLRTCPSSAGCYLSPVHSRHKRCHTVPRFASAGPGARPSEAPAFSSTPKKLIGSKEACLRSAQVNGKGSKFFPNKLGL